MSQNALTKYGDLSGEALAQVGRLSADSSTNNLQALDGVIKIANDAADAQKESLNILSEGAKTAQQSVERMAKASATNGQSVIAETLVSIFKPIGVGAAVVAGLFAISGVFKRV